MTTRAFPHTADTAARAGYPIEASFRDFLALFFDGDRDRVERVIEQAATEPELPLPTDPRFLDEVRDMPHGSTCAYRHGCRCDECRAGESERKHSAYLARSTALGHFRDAA